MSFEIDNNKEEIVFCVVVFFICATISFFIYCMYNEENNKYKSQVQINESNNAILHSMMEHNMSKENIDMFIKSKSN